MGRRGSRAVREDIDLDGMIKGIEHGLCHGGRVSDGSEDALSATASDLSRLAGAVSRDWGYAVHLGSYRRRRHAFPSGRQD